MGAQLLLIPALFVTICATFIILHSCYHRWKMSTILKKKRDAAKISLVNILQMTNATLIIPPWSNNAAGKSKVKPTLLLVPDETDAKQRCPSGCEQTDKSRSFSPSTFDPRNPNVLSSVLTLNDPHNLPPPCYDDLYGPERSVFTFKSLSPERDDPPPFSSSHTESNTRMDSNIVRIMAEGGDRQHSGNGTSSSCLLQVPQQGIPGHCQERRNSSAVLYL